MGHRPMVNLTRATYPMQCAQSAPSAPALTIPRAYPYPPPFQGLKRPCTGRILRTPQALPARPENSAAGFRPCETKNAWL